MDPTLATAVLVLALILAGVVTGVRVVPVGSCAVVTRLGRLRKVVPSGLAFVLPMVDRLEEMPGAQPSRTEPVPVSATTRDGVDVRLTLSLLWRVTEPGQAVLASPDPATATADAAERSLHHLVAATDLAALLDGLPTLVEELLPRVNGLSEAWGVHLLDVEVFDAELRLGPQLRRLMR